MKKQFFFFIVSLLIMINGLHAQQANTRLGEPVVGQKCPWFRFEVVDFYSKKKVTLDDFKGKWLVLDFWNRECSSCIGSFPTISQEQVEFADSIQFLMVSFLDYKNLQRPMYVKYHQELELKMPCAYDSSLFKSFNVGPLPLVIIIDPTGIVRAITVKASAQKYRDLLAGRNPAFGEASFAVDKAGVEKVRHDINRPFLVAGNGGEDSAFLFRSLLSKWKPRDPQNYTSQVIYDGGMSVGIHAPGRFEVLGCSLDILYRAAYSGRGTISFKDDTSLYGKFSSRPVLEIKDPAVFKGDYASGRDIYSYSLMVPPMMVSKEYMMKIMQNDLKSYFGYDVSIETRKMPFWKVVASDSARIKLISNGNGARYFSEKYGPWQGFEVKNYPIDEFIETVAQFADVTNDGTPLFNETGITGKIDIDIQCVKGDYRSIQSALRRTGMDLVKAEREMKVIVIRDPK